MSRYTLSLKSSQSPGCMRRLPASYSCHARMVPWISAAAAVCVSPAASRAARIASGAGLAEGPFGPRFGWVGMSGAGLVAGHLDAGRDRELHGHAVTADGVNSRGLDDFLGAGNPAPHRHVLLHDRDSAVKTLRGGELAECRQTVRNSGADFRLDEGEGGLEGLGDSLVSEGCSHFDLQAPDLPRRAGQRCAVHGSYYARIAWRGDMGQTL